MGDSGEEEPGVSSRERASFKDGNAIGPLFAAALRRTRARSMLCVWKCHTICMTVMSCKTHLLSWRRAEFKKFS